METKPASAIRTTATPLMRSRSATAEMMAWVEAGRLPVEVNILDTVYPADRSIVTSRLEDRVDKGIVLQIGTVHDQSEVVNRHLRFPRRSRTTVLVLLVWTPSDEAAQLLRVNTGVTRRGPD